MIVITDVCFLFEKISFGLEWKLPVVYSRLGRTTAAIFIFQCAVVDVESSMALELAQPRFFLRVHH